MKLFFEGGTPKLLVMLGELKSSISSLNTIPLTGDRTLEPKLQGLESDHHVRLAPFQPPASPSSSSPEVSVLPRGVFRVILKGMGGVPYWGKHKPLALFHHCQPAAHTRG